MTQCSIPSEAFPQYQEELVDTPSISDHDQLETETHSSDWESQIASLVGLEEESTEVDTNVPEDVATLQASSSESQEIPPEQPLSSNPFAKLGLVGTATFAVVLVAGAFLSQLMNTNQGKPQQIRAVSTQQQTPIKRASRLQTLETEVETLKTKLALAEQAEAMKAAQEKLRNRKLTQPAQSVAQRVPREEPRSSASQLGWTLSRTPTPVQTVYIPRVVRAEPTAQAPQAPKKPETPPQPVAKATPKPTPDPLQEWLRLAKLGSYGQVASAKSIEKPRTPAPVNSTLVSQSPNPIPNQAQPVENLSVTEVQQTSPKSVAVGSKAKAELATAIFGETTKSTGGAKNEEGKNVFVVRLREPLKSVDGEIALPANTEVLTEVHSLSEQGLLHLKVVKVILQNNGSLSEKSLPSNAMIIRAPQGKPLLANRFPNQSSSIAGMDASLFVLGGLGKAAELFNRTEAQVVTTTTTGTIVSNTNPRRNVLAGILEGGMNSVVPQIAQRNQQAIAQMMQRTNIWFLPAGTDVELYVNQGLQF